MIFSTKENNFALKCFLFFQAYLLLVGDVVRVEHDFHHSYTTVYVYDEKIITLTHPYIGEKARVRSLEVVVPHIKDLSSVHA